MRRLADFRPIAFEAPTSQGTNIRFVARVHVYLTFDAIDAVTGELLGQLDVWDYSRSLGPTPRMLLSSDWTLESRVYVEMTVLGAGDVETDADPVRETLEEALDRFLSLCPS